jgi:hypothetical protein
VGDLADAIREHLELKRRRGADPSEVAREEHEALAPVTRSHRAVLPAPSAHAEADLDVDDATRVLTLEDAHEYDAGPTRAFAEAAADWRDLPRPTPPSRPRPTPAAPRSAARPATAAPRTSPRAPTPEPPAPEAKGSTNDNTTQEFRVEFHHDWLAYDDE